MNITTRFKELIKTSYPPKVLRFLRFTGLILLGLDLVLVVTVSEYGIQDYLDFVLASLLLFAGITSMFPAVRIGFMFLRFVFNCIKKMVLGVWAVPNEVKQMSSFQRYVLILIALLIGVIFITVIMK
jgi:hypothetical protein